jgi:hypothetical protein
MQSTYSFPEVKSLVRSLDFSSLNLLKELVEEERECFSTFELRAIERFLKVKNRQFVKNEVKLDFLLSFN